ncbi:Peroxiredoxin HYR1 [Candida viswanathii]|uniref:Glutathione peroxidase n=1 Tax=Candida viswanathii TaxID=5486 RepID=A0A367XW46_9ASCO|nr:Peroxiredoxin HYR1 [Candida viswanathii]
MSEFYQLTPKDAKGEPYPFTQLEGKVVLIVNVASKCGFTPQYKGLEELNQKYKDKNVQILGFPCNQFGHQEPGTNEEIANFCSLNYGVSFPVLDKIDVNGDKTDPVYKYLKSQKAPQPWIATQKPFGTRWTSPSPKSNPNSTRLPARSYCRNRNVQNASWLDLKEDTSDLSPTSAREKFYQLSPLDNSLSPFSFNQLRNKVILVVNVALYCGFRFQYKRLEALQKKYEHRGFTIVGFPCNQFLFQEPLTNEKIIERCRNKYDVTFPIMNKIHVNGPETDEVYKFLKESKHGLWGTKRVKWNFEKFLIDRDGNVVARYSTFTTPEAISGKIEELLQQKKM